MNRYRLLLFLALAPSPLLAEFPKGELLLFPMAINTRIRLHVGDPVAGGATTATWFGPVDFTGESPWEGFTKEYEDASNIRPPNDSPDNPADLHDKVLFLCTEGENLYYDPGTLAAQPATQVVAMRVRFIATDAALIGQESNPRYPHPPAGTGTALYLFQSEEEPHGCFHLYTGKGGQPKWVAVAAEGLTPQNGEWHDVRFTLDSSSDNTLVSCHVDGLLLSDETGATSFPIATGSGRKVVNALSFFGVGDVDSMSGCAVPSGEVFPTQESFSAQLAAALATAERPISVGGDGTFAMQFSAPLAGTYTLQTAATPGADFRDTHVARTVPAGTVVRLVDPNATGNAAFYRVRFSR